MAYYIGQQEEIKQFQSRFFYLAICVAIMFLILFIRLWYLQILKGAEFKDYSNEIALRAEKIPAPRGMFFDRQGEVLVDNYPAFDIVVTPQYLEEKEETVVKVAELLEMDPNDIRFILHKGKDQPPFMPIVIKEDVSRDEMAKIETNKLEIKGVDVAVEIKRKYLLGQMGAQLLGYIGEVNASELTRVNNERLKDFYRQGDFIGKFGLEEFWEETIRGIDGATYVEVDARGKRKTPKESKLLGAMKRKDPQVGNNLVLTIDAKLQRVAAESLKGKVGAVVALDPNSGEVLAMSSQPSFDPSDFSRGIAADLWKVLVEDPNNPLRNKAIQDHYPPGSTFKVITALAGLEEGAISPQKSYFCGGTFYYRRGQYDCWMKKKGGHKETALQKAIAQSCDFYFYNVGVEVGVDNLAKYAQMLGLGSKTGIALYRELPGIVPSTEWKKKKFGQLWIPGETPPIAIGQGYLNVSPIQLANLYAAIANGGSLYTPYVVKAIQDPDGNIIKEFKPELISKININQKNLALIKEGLYGVVNIPGGTAYWSARLDGYDIAGKTGTSQVVRIKKEDEEKKCEEVDFKLRDHAWFVGFAPIDKPQIVVAVLAEHDCHPYYGAAQTVRAVIKAYLEGKIDSTVLRKIKKTETVKEGDASGD